MAKIQWVKDRCPICGREYLYPEGGYKPSTCGSFECVQQYIHPELRKRNYFSEARE